jgi:hypothetical protein
LSIVTACDGYTVVTAAVSTVGARPYTVIAAAVAASNSDPPTTHSHTRRRGRAVGELPRWIESFARSGLFIEKFQAPAP